MTYLTVTVDADFRRPTKNPTWGMDEAARRAWTDARRVHAEKAARPEDLEDFRKIVSPFRDLPLCRSGSLTGPTLQLKEVLWVNGERDPEAYVEVDAGMLDG